MTDAEPLLGPVPLDAAHSVETFACGVDALDEFLVKQALSDRRAGKSRTYVACRGRRVVAYFSLATASVAASDATERAVRGQGPQAIPAILLARFTVDRAEQGRGLGGALLVEALARCAEAAEIVGVRVVLVHAKDGRARDFYLRHDFEPTPANPLQLMILMKDVGRTLESLG